MLLAHCPVLPLIAWIYTFIVYPIGLIVSLTLGLGFRKGSTAWRVGWGMLCGFTVLLGVFVLAFG